MVHGLASSVCMNGDILLKGLEGVNVYNSDLALFQDNEIKRMK